MLYACRMGTRSRVVLFFISGLIAQNSFSAERVTPCPTFKSASVNCFPVEEPRSLISDIESEELEDFIEFQHCQRRMVGRIASPNLPTSEKLNLSLAGSTEGFECSVDLKFEITRWGRPRKIASYSECPEFSVLERAAIQSLGSSRFRKSLRKHDCTHTVTFEFR